MKLEEIILCNDKKTLIDLIRNNSEIKASDIFDLSELKAIALNLFNQKRILNSIKQENDKQKNKE